MDDITGYHGNTIHIGSTVTRAGNPDEFVVNNIDYVENKVDLEALGFGNDQTGVNSNDVIVVD